jgi:hypothetical protein
MNFDYDDIYDLEADIYSKNHRTPQQIMLESYEGVFKRDWKKFLDSIEWDGLWLKHDTPEEKREKEEKMQEIKRQQELENHPFKQWF